MRAVATTGSLYQDKKVLAIRPENVLHISDVLLSFEKQQMQSIVRTLKCGHSNLKRRLANPADPAKCDQKAVVIFLECLPTEIVDQAQGIIIIMQ